MKNNDKRTTKSVSKKQATAQKTEIKDLIKRNDFWIGVATVFGILLVSGVFVSRHFPLGSKAESLSQKPTQSPEPTRSLTAILPAGVKKLADTSGFIGFITKNKPTPTPTATPKTSVASNSQSNQPQQATRNSGQNNSSTNQTTTVVTIHPTVEPIASLVETYPTPVVAAISEEEIVYPTPTEEIKPTESPVEIEHEPQDEAQHEQDNGSNSHEHDNDHESDSDTGNNSQE